MPTAVCISFKRELFEGIHKLDHSYKMALYTQTDGLGEETTIYSTANEVVGGTGYIVGGKQLLHPRIARDGASATLEFDGPISWSQASFTARAALIYNASAENRAVCVWDFGKDYTSTNGTFKIDSKSGTIKIS